MSSTSVKRGEPWVRSRSELSPLVCTIWVVLIYINFPFRYLVYNLRKRGGDSADKYFKSTEMIAGVKDMRFQVSHSGSLSLSLRLWESIL